MFHSGIQISSVSGMWLPHVPSVLLIQWGYPNKMVHTSHIIRNVKQPWKDKEKLPLYNLPDGLFSAQAILTNFLAEDLIVCVMDFIYRAKPYTGFLLLSNTKHCSCPSIGFVGLQTDTELPINLWSHDLKHNAGSKSHNVGAELRDRHPALLFNR